MQPPKKNERLTLSIQDLSPDGQGVGKTAGGFVVYVPGTLPGETVQAHIIKTTARYAVGKLLSRQQDSPDRTPPPCPVFGRCGGCQLQHLAYEAQLRHKQAMVRQCLTRIGGLQQPEVRPTLGMDQPWHYRNKGQFPCAEVDGKAALGLFASRSHRLVPVEDCPIEHPLVNAVVQATGRWMAEYDVPAYDEARHAGMVRHVMARVGEGVVMAVLVTRKERVPHLVSWTEAMLAIPEVQSVYQVINNQRTNVVLSGDVRHLAGDPVITTRLGEAVFEVHPRSFFQVNTEQTLALYEQVRQAAALTGGEVLWDVYCGVGTISQYLGREAGQILGVEEAPEAVENARRNAQRNGLPHARYEAGRAESVLPRWAAEGLRADVVVLDPPRKGCEPALLQTLTGLQPGRIVYVSCNPATLARDVKILHDGGYILRYAQPVDLFPQTSGVETVALLSKEIVSE